VTVLPSRTPALEPLFAGSSLTPLGAAIRPAARVLLVSLHVLMFGRELDSFGTSFTKRYRALRG
jgi:hypothetical protein